MNYLGGKDTSIGGVSLWHVDVQGVVVLKFGVRYGAIGNGCYLGSYCPIAARVVIDVFSLGAGETMVIPHLRMLGLEQKIFRLKKH